MLILSCNADVFVSGVHDNEDSCHVTQLSKLALQLMMAVKNLSKKEVGRANKRSQVRVGLHTGREERPEQVLGRTVCKRRSYELCMCLRYVQ